MLRFLNLRYPRDYNTVPRLYFWLFHLLWFFPWSLYFPAALEIEVSGRGPGVAGAAAGVVLGGIHSDILHVFDDAGILLDALLSGAGAAAGVRDGERGRVAASGGRERSAVVAALALAAICAILWMVRGLPAPGDIASALTQNPDVYTLSLGHMTDLTMAAFAYLRLPLAVAGVAFAVGAIGRVAAARRRRRSLVAMMVLFFHAARLALVVFDPYMSSRPLAEALLAAPPGKLIVDDQYYTFSSVFFYTNRRALSVERAGEQSGVRIVCAGRAAGRVHRRRGIPAAVEERRAILPGGRRA